MRIIEQYGAFDLPYNISAIRTDNDGCVYASIPGIDIVYVMAVYSSEEKAKEALKKLRIAYQRHENEIERAVGRLTEYFQFPLEEHL